MALKWPSEGDTLEKEKKLQDLASSSLRNGKTNRDKL